VKSLLVAILAAEQPTYGPKEASIAAEGNNFLFAFSSSSNILADQMSGIPLERLVLTADQIVEPNGLRRLLDNGQHTPGQPRTI
jgi:hypothetical protein